MSGFNSQPTFYDKLHASYPAETPSEGALPESPVDARCAAIDPYRVHPLEVAKNVLRMMCTQSTIEQLSAAEGKEPSSVEALKEEHENIRELYLARLAEVTQVRPRHGAALVALLASHPAWQDRAAAAQILPHIANTVPQTTGLLLERLAKDFRDSRVREVARASLRAVPESVMDINPHVTPERPTRGIPEVARWISVARAEQFFADSGFSDRRISGACRTMWMPQVDRGRVHQTWNRVAPHPVATIDDRGLIEAHSLRAKLQAVAERTHYWMPYAVPLFPPRRAQGLDLYEETIRENVTAVKIFVNSLFPDAEPLPVDEEKLGDITD